MTHKNLLVKKNGTGVASKLWQRHFLHNITGVTPKRILILQDGHCALTALFKMLTFVTTRLTKIHMHTHDLNWNRNFCVKVINRIMCVLRHITAILLHTVWHISFKRLIVIPTVLLKTLTIIFYIFSKQEYLEN